MKQVIINQPPQNTVSIDKVSDNKYYGVEAVKGDKGFIANKDYSTNNYEFRCRDSLTKGNKWNGFSSRNLDKAIRSWLMFNDENRQVYEFDTAEELFDWLSK